MADQPKDAGLIRDWHAHVYYDPERTKQQAAELRGWIEQRFPVRMGRWHDVPVGPHPGAMYQVAFAPEVFPAIVPWLALNRQGLTVLVHPETDRPRDDHLLHAIWLGERLPLKGDVLPEIDRGE
jgi:DOPA 4,5-dioxygenase